MAEIISAIVGILTIAAGTLIGIFTLGRKVQTIQEQTDENTKDLNGMGRKFAKDTAYKIRELAAECKDEVLKEKLIALAIYVEPK